MPSPSSSRRSFSAGSSSRGVNPERCSTGQKRLPGLAKWRPVAAEYSPGLIPQNSTSRPGAITSGTSLPAAAASAAGEGRSSFGSVMALRTIARAARPGRGSVDCSGRSARGGRMTARTLDGRAVAAQIQQELADEVERLASVGARPGLAAVLVGDDEASHIYVGAKQRAAARWGIDSREVALPATATQRQVLDAVAELNADPTVHGIIVQLPLPHGLDPVRVQEAIDPTKDVDGLHPWNEGRVLRGMVDAVNVTDNAAARVAMAPIPAAVLVAAEGLEPVLQLTCRDRNRLALAADLLGAHALGVRAILCLSGDPIEVGPFTDAKAVFDLDAVGLTRLAADLGQGVGPGGTAVGGPAPFLIGAAEAPGVDPSGGARLEAKIAAGARFVQTQPVFDVAGFTV